METVGAERAGSRLGADEEAARKRAAVETYAQNETVLRRTARRYSLCVDDADDALQRGLEILLRKAPTTDPRELIKWMQTVVKHEALAIRRDRERILAGPAAVTAEQDADDWIALLPADSDGPPERIERREAIARSREALQALKPQELRALTLLAEGYSYSEIGEITGYSRTKVNRCLAEGRERFRKLIARSEDGRRCAELRPLLSAFCDGEAGAEEVAELREHLRACASCRSTLRAYRAVPAGAAALGPLIPADGSLWARLHDACEGIVGRFGGADPVTQVAVGGGASGAGAATLAKGAALCAGIATAVACVATGLIPAPLGGEPELSRQAQLQRQLEGFGTPGPNTRRPEPTSAPAAPERKPRAEAKPGPEPQPAPVPQEPHAESEPGAEAPASSGTTVEYAPAPVAEPAPAPSPSGGNPAGEFGP